MWPSCLLDKEEQHCAVRSQIGWDAGKDTDFPRLPRRDHRRRGLEEATSLCSRRQQRPALYLCGPIHPLGARYSAAWCAMKSWACSIARATASIISTMKPSIADAVFDPGVHRAAKCPLVLAGTPARAAIGSHQHDRSAKHRGDGARGSAGPRCPVIQQAFRCRMCRCSLREEDHLVMRAHHGALTPNFPARRTVSCQPGPLVAGDRNRRNDHREGSECATAGIPCGSSRNALRE